jgi:1,4-alpha-glucan branching enzyme
MGWMHDTLAYFEHEPIHRRWHHHSLTFSLVYAFTENFILPLSHDEVVHGKGSMLSKMPGDRWQQLANLRALYAFMWAHPGKKLLFMGCEFAQEQEWSEQRSLDWHLLEQREHSGMQSLVRDLNGIYRSTPALYERDYDHTAFWWIEPNDANNSVFAFARMGHDARKPVVFVANLTPVPRHGYRMGLPVPGRWRELINTDAEGYGGSGEGNLGGVDAEDVSWMGQYHSAEITIPPLAALLFVPEDERKAETKKA